jgi:hypothetical protein
MVTKPQRGDINWDVGLNTALDQLQAAADAKLPLAGGTLSGPLAVTGPVSATAGGMGEASPPTHNLISWSFDPALATNSSILTNGTVYLTKMNVSAAVACTKIYWWVAVAGVTATAGQNFVGLYSSAGTLLASANVDADVTSAGLKTTTISSQSLSAGTFVWVAMVSNAATAPTMARMAGLTGLSAAVNVGLTASAYRFAINGTALTSLPASITPASNAVPNFGGPWAAIGA